MSNVSIVALGGLDEIGKNLYCVEFDNKLFVVDCGLKRPEETFYGVDFIIPDFTYLVENKEKVQAIIITHFHDDMMYALPYLMKEINVPIYASEFATIYIEEMFKEANITNYKLNVLKRFSEIYINDVKVKTFGLTHATADALGISICTPDGQIVFAEQFVIDFDEHDKGYETDINKIAEISKEKVLCALIEASSSDVAGYTAPRHRIGKIIKPVMEDAQGRIFITVYQQNMFRINEILKLAKDLKKRVFIYDDQLRSYIRIAQTHGYFSFNETTFIPSNEIDNNKENCVIIVSDNGKNVFAKMNKIATGEDKLFELRNSDTVIIASPGVSGTEKEASAMENELYRCNVGIFKLNRKEVLSLHPAVDDIKMMLYLLKPDYFIPVMGDYRDFINAANLSLEQGFRPDRIVILDNGQVARFENGRIKSTSNFVHVGETMIGQSNRNIASSVLTEREVLASDGVVIIGISVDYKTKRIAGGPDIQSRGVVYVRDSERLIENLAKYVVNTIKQHVAAGTYNNMAIRNEIKEEAARMVLRETGKRPLIIPAIIEINL